MFDFSTKLYGKSKKKNIIQEERMAKSNPKKEKAERNKAYARQFRKKNDPF